MDKVRGFLKSFRPGLVYDIVPIHDVYGPTAVDPDIQALVVSKETMKGASSSSCSIAHFFMADESDSM
jgi:pantetheine-phosphate adenylyltransferase